MPTISGFKQSTISNRVGGASLNREGSGAVAREIANLGKTGTDFATALLAERKKFQAINYAEDKKTELDRMRQDFIQENQNLMDSATGKMPDGRDFLEVVKEFEDTQRQTYMEGAPTEMAKQAFMGKTGDDYRNSLLKADAYQHSTTLNYRKTAISEGFQQRAKDIRSLPADQLNAAIKEFEEDASETLAQYKGSIYNDEEVRLQHRQAMNDAGMQLLEGAFQNDRADIMSFQLRHEIRNNPKVKEKIRAQVEASLNVGAPEGTTPKKVQRVITLEDGSLVAEVLGEGDGPKYFDPVKGQFIQFADPTMFDFSDMINIEGEGPKSVVEKYLTPAQKDAQVDKMLNLIKAKRSENLGLLKRKQQDFMEAFRSDNNLVKKRFGQDPVFDSAFKQHVTNVLFQVDDQDEQARLLQGLALAKGMGELMDALPRQGPKTAATAMAQLDKKADSFLESLSGFIPPEVMSPEFMAGMRNNFLAEAQRAQAVLEEQKLKDPAKYVQTHFPEVSALKNATVRGTMEDRAKAQQKFSDKVSQIEDSLGVPDYLKSVGGLTNDEKTAHAKDFMNAVSQQGSMGAQAAASKLAEWKQLWGEDYSKIVTSMKGSGLEPRYTYAAMLPLDSRQGQSDATQIIMNTKSKYYDIAPDSVKTSIDAVTYDKVKGFNKSIIQGLNFGDDVVSTQTLTTIVSDEVARRAFEFQGDKGSKSTPSKSQLEEYADDAIKLVTNHFMNVDTGRSSVNFRKAVLDKARVTEDMATRAVEAAEDEDFIYSIIDPIKSFPSLGEQLDQFGIKDPKKREDFLRAKLKSQNFVGRVDADGNLYPSIRVGGNTIPLTGKDGRTIKIPLEQYNSFIEGYSRGLIKGVVP